jgi:hypothetical protein
MSLMRRAAAVLALLGYHLSRYKFLFIQLDELVLGLLVLAPAYYLGWRSWRTGLQPWQIALSAVCLLLLPAFWFVRRQHYTLFEVAPANGDEASPLKAEEKIRVRGAGYFEVSGMRRYFVAAPAAFWKTELEDYILMARINVVEIPLLIAPSEEQGMWYIFINSQELAGVTPGALLFGFSSLPTLQIAYRPSAGARVFAYLSFEHTSDLRRVLLDLSNDLCGKAPRSTNWRSATNCL